MSKEKFVDSKEYYNFFLNNFMTNSYFKKYVPLGKNSSFFFIKKILEKFYFIYYFIKNEILINLLNIYF